MPQPFVIFDLGGVLVQQDFDRLRPALSPDLDPASWARWLLSSPLALGFERGAVSVQDFSEGVVAELGRPGVSPAAFQAAFDDWVVGPMPGALALLDEVAAAGLGRAALSNCNAVHAPRLRRMGLVERLDPLLLSHELGLAKPDPEIFPRVAEILGHSPDELLFLDDNPANVAAATRAGWRATCVRGVDQAAEALAGYLGPARSTHVRSSQGGSGAR